MSFSPEDVQTSLSFVDRIAREFRRSRHDLRHAIRFAAEIGASPREIAEAAHLDPDEVRHALT